MNIPVVVTGLGFVTSIGHSRAAVSQSLRSLKHGFTAWQPVARILKHSLTVLQRTGPEVAELATVRD